MERVCVFCGSSSGTDPVYGQAAEELGREIARRNMTLVYGGGSVGLMGTVAKSVLDSGGEVIGVITRLLVSRELAYERVARMHVVETMHERKAMMAELSDGFIALPGGFGTLEEFFEALTWQQLGIHRKPCGLLNSGGYYDALIEFINRCEADGFVKARQRQAMLIDQSAAGLLGQLEAFHSSAEDRTRDQIS